MNRLQLSFGCASAAALAAALVACSHTEHSSVQAPNVYASSGASSTSSDDAALAQAIHAALRRDAVLSSQNLTVTASQGSVTVAGTLPSLAAKNRALQLIGTFRGPRSIIDELFVSASTRPNRDVVRDVLADLARDPATRSAHVTASAAAGTLTLTGTVDSPIQRELVEAVASQASGVQAINDELTTALTAARSDDEVAADVRERIADDARLDGTRLSVAVQNGGARIFGTVGSLAARAAAVGDSWVAGVSRVDASRVVVSSETAQKERQGEQPSLPSNARLVALVNRSLAEDPRVSPLLPEVRVLDGGIVVLSGAVATDDARVDADRDVLGIRGIWTVDDRMRVAPPGTASAATLQKNEKTASTARNVQVTTTSGTVRLPGAVANQQARQWIERDASGTPGVVGRDEEIQIQSVGSATSAALADRIRDRAVESIFWDPRVTGGRVSIAVASGGEATLTGTVDTWGEARAAEEDVRRAGASVVRNQIRVRALPAFTAPAAPR